MNRTPLHSSNIASAGYDAEAQLLEVEFSNGGVYTYQGVEPEVYAGLMEADSPGSYLHRNIKFRYAYTKGGTG